MKKLLTILLAACLLLSCCPAAAAVSAYEYTSRDKQEIETFLGWFRWIGTDYSGAEPWKANTDWHTSGLLGALVQNPLAVDYAVYPVEQPDLSWDMRKDPLGKWSGYWRFPETSVDWVLTYVFALPEKDIAAMKASVDAGKEPYIYRYNGAYYSFPGGVGGGYEAKITRMTKDDYYYRVTYRLSGGDGYWEDMGVRYALFTRSGYDGKEYWALRYDGGAEPAADLPFLDVPAGSYCAGDIRWAIENSITSGTSALTFSPDGTCTRAQAVTFLWRAAGEPKARGQGDSFRDVPPNAYYADAVAWAAANGIAGGTGDGRFDPDASCSRAQIVTFLYRAAGRPASASGASFEDVPAGLYYSTPVRWAVDNGITSGTSAGRFSPNAPCTRGQIAAFLHRADGVQ